MTEVEWLECRTPEPLLQYARPLLNERKLRLFSCACCRRIWHLLAAPRSRAAVSVAELYADGLVDREQMEHAWQNAEAVVRAAPPEQRHAALAAAACARTENVTSAASAVCSAASTAVRAAATDPLLGTKAWHAERKEQAALLRDMIRNPFRPDTLPLTLPPTAAPLAEAMYAGQECSFALHDLLAEERNRELANHFKVPGHVKGCWALDFILSKDR